MRGGRHYPLIFINSKLIVKKKSLSLSLSLSLSFSLCLFILFLLLFQMNFTKRNFRKILEKIACNILLLLFKRADARLVFD